MHFMLPLCVSVRVHNLPSALLEECRTDVHFVRLKMWRNNSSKKGNELCVQHRNKTLLAHSRVHLPACLTSHRRIEKATSDTQSFPQTHLKLDVLLLSFSLSVYASDWAIEALVSSSGSLREHFETILDGTPNMWSVDQDAPTAFMPKPLHSCSQRVNSTLSQDS